MRIESISLALVLFISAQRNAQSAKADLPKTALRYRLGRCFHFHLVPPSNPRILPLIGRNAVPRGREGCAHWARRFVL
jgi:hypothetical protein